MPAVKLIADVAFIDGHPLLNELRMRLKELPSIILCLISNLRLPGMNLLSPMLGVWLKWRYFIRIVMSSHICHLNPFWSSCSSNFLRICSNQNTRKSSSEAFHIFFSHS